MISASTSHGVHSTSRRLRASSPSRELRPKPGYLQLGEFVLLVAACVLLAGCDYTVPLAPPAKDIDPALVGTWERTNEQGHAEQLLILPLERNEYFVSYPVGKSDSMFAKAWLADAAGMTLVQVEWFGNANGPAEPDDKGDNRVFQLASCQVRSNELEVALLNPSVVTNGVATSEALAAAIEKSKDDPDLFHQRMVFRKAPQE